MVSAPQVLQTVFIFTMKDFKLAVEECLICEFEILHSEDEHCLKNFRRCYTALGWYKVIGLVANATINQLSPNSALDGLQQLPIGSFNKTEFGMGIFIAYGLIYWGWASGIYHRSRAISSSWFTIDRFSGISSAVSRILEILRKVIVSAWSAWGLALSSEFST